jgi:hypothetical protein
MLAGRGEIERTFQRLPRDESGFAAVASGEDGLAAAHVKAAFDLPFLLPVTGDTFFTEERLDATDKERLGLVGGRDRLREGGGRERERKKEAMDRMKAVHAGLLIIPGYGGRVPQKKGFFFHSTLPASNMARISPAERAVR